MICHLEIDLVTWLAQQSSIDVLLLSLDKLVNTKDIMLGFRPSIKGWGVIATPNQATLNNLAEFNSEYNLNSLESIVNYTGIIVGFYPAEDAKTPLDNSMNKEHFTQILCALLKALAEKLRFKSFEDLFSKDQQSITSSTYFNMLMQILRDNKVQHLESTVPTDNRYFKVRGCIILLSEYMRIHYQILREEEQFFILKELVRMIYMLSQKFFDKKTYHAVLGTVVIIEALGKFCAELKIEKSYKSALKLKEQAKNITAQEQQIQTSLNSLLLYQQARLSPLGNMIEHKVGSLKIKYKPI